MDGVLAKVSGARALRAYGHPAHADQHGLRVGRDGRRARPGAGGGGDAADDPRPHALLAGRVRASPSTRTRRRRSASTRTRGPGRATCWSGSGSRPTSFPRWCRPATVLGAARAATSPTRRGSAGHGRGRRDPRHRLGSRCDPAASAQGRRSSARGRGRSSGSSCRDRVIDDRTYAANLTNEGGVARHRARPPERHRSLAAPRVPPGLGAGGLRPLVRAARRTSQSPRRTLRSLVDPNDPLFAAPDDMPRRIREYCARHRPARAARIAGRVVRCVLESLALKHAQTLDLLRRRPGSSCARCTSSAAARATSCSAAGLLTRPASPCTPGPSRRPRSGTCSSRRLALGELGSLDDAREVVRASFEPTVVRARRGGALARGPRAVRG